MHAYVVWTLWISNKTPHSLLSNPPAILHVQFGARAAAAAHAYAHNLLDGLLS